MPYGRTYQLTPAMHADPRRPGRQWVPGWDWPKNGPAQLVCAKDCTVWREPDWAALIALSTDCRPPLSSALVYASIRSYFTSSAAAACAWLFAAGAPSR